MGKPIIVVVGTRPDALKLILLYQLFKQAGIPTLLCSTQQHKQLLDDVFTLFDVKPDITLDVMRENQTLDYLTAAILQKTSAFFSSVAPRLVIVQGDTTTSFAAALAAFYLKIPVAHVEAGLRTGNLAAPFPEELNRIFISKLSSFHFAPTPTNVLNLLKEGVPGDTVFCVGNTIVDALHHITEQIKQNALPIDPVVKKIVKQSTSEHKRLVLLTMHRRESFDGGIARVLKTIKSFAQEHPDVLFFFPTHPNPNVQQAVADTNLASQGNVICHTPLQYTDLIYVLTATSLVITDSGGIQEEAVSLGKPVLILREETERIEAIWENLGILIGTNEQKLKTALIDWIGKPVRSQQKFLYGTGDTCKKILQILINQDTLFVPEELAAFNKTCNTERSSLL